MGFPGGSDGKAMRETRVQFLGREDPLEKEMAIHSSTLAWKIPWTEKPDRLQSMGLQRVGHDWVTSLSLSLLGWIGWWSFPENVELEFKNVVSLWLWLALQMYKLLLCEADIFCHAHGDTGKLTYLEQRRSRHTAINRGESPYSPRRERLP